MNRRTQEPITALSHGWFRREVLTVAPDLLGKLLVRRLAGGELLVGRIVETEAYREDDPASHSHRGRTARTAAMFEDGGAAYVYLIYGMHHCFNVVVDREGVGSAVLVRAVEPLYGLDSMRRYRYGGGGAGGAGGDGGDGGGGAGAGGDCGGGAGGGAGGRNAEAGALTAAQRAALTNGPGKLARSFAITTAAHNGVALYRGVGGSDLTIAERVETADGIELTATSPRRAAQSPRIGIRAAAELPWRFTDPDSYALSRPAGG